MLQYLQWLDQQFGRMIISFNYEIIIHSPDGISQRAH